MPDVKINRRAQTIRPADLDGDREFGLLSGTNGTGAETRRAVAELAHDARGYRWQTHRGHRASGLDLRPPERPHFANPWGAA